MKLHRSAAALLLVGAVQVFAQTAPAPGGTAPGFTPNLPASAYSRPLRAPMAARNAGANAANPITLRQRVSEMESTVSKMHEVLEQMHNKAALSRDSATKANLELWTQMVTHLDGELKDLKVTMALREDIEARRAAMYKQADARAQAEAAIASRKFATLQPSTGQPLPTAPVTTPGTSAALK